MKYRKRVNRFIWLAFASIVAVVLYAAPILATGETGGAEPTPVQLPEHLTPEEVRSLIAHLSDDQVRALLIQQLDKVAQTEASQAPSTLGFRPRVTLWLEQVEGTWRNMVQATTQELPEVPAVVWEQVTDAGLYGSFRTVLELALALFVGWVLERLFQRLSAGVLRQSDRATESFLSLALIVAARLLLGLMALALFGLGTTATGALLFGEERMHARQLLSVLMWGILVYRIWALFLRAVLAPKMSAWRLIPLSNVAARGIYTRTLIVVAVITIDRAIEHLLAVFLFDWDVILAISTFQGVLIIAVLLGLILQARKPVAAMIRGDARDADAKSAALWERFADIWHLLAVAYLMLIWVLMVEYKLSTGEIAEWAGLVSLSLPLIAWFVDMGLRRLCSQLLGKHVSNGAVTPTTPDGQESGEEASEASGAEPPTGGSVYEALALRYLRILLAVLMVVIFIALWDLNPGTWLAVIVGTRVTTALFDIGVTVFLAYIVWGIIKTAIESHVGSEPSSTEHGHGGGDAGGMGGTRVETLLPLLRKFLWVTLLTIVVMVSLSSLGVNIGPLIAGAGVLGIAIGFGAQTLVRDIVSGFFFLLDDAFRIGEYVEIDDNTQGTVEKISVRSFQLRHHTGPVHTVPFGEIPSLTNYSRDWAIMKFELRLPFETNIDQVRKIIKKVGQEMLDDPDIGPNLLEPLKSQGVNRMDDSALIIRCKFTAIPGEQFVIRREAFTRIQRAFEAQGIHFAPRRVLVEAATPAAAAAGAAAALDQEAKPQSAGDDRG